MGTVFEGKYRAHVISGFWAIGVFLLISSLLCADELRGTLHMGFGFVVLTLLLLIDSMVEVTNKIGAVRINLIKKILNDFGEITDDEFQESMDQVPILDLVQSVVAAPVEWLKEPNPQLGDRAPIELLGTPEENKVRNLLTAVNQGLQ